MTDFVDSNVLVYSLVAEDRRFESAVAILGEGPVTSVQALNEMVSVARSKYRIAWPDVNRAVGLVEQLVTAVHPLLPEDNRHARTLAQRYRLQWWDALIVATALRSGADRLITEDLQQGQILEERLEIVNPFAGAR